MDPLHPANSIRIAIPSTDGEIAARFPVMVQLRPHLAADSFVETVKHLMKQGYLLVALSNETKIIVVAGWAGQGSGAGRTAAAS